MYNMTLSLPLKGVTTHVVEPLLEGVFFIYRDTTTKLQSASVSSDRNVTILRSEGPKGMSTVEAE